jgi:cyclopropane fatty-acyl-phospholipid synthase-like methyltransferase
MSESLEERTLPGDHEFLFQRIAKLPGIGPDTTVLDLGCGSGAWLNRLSNNGFRVLYGVDADPPENRIPNAIIRRADLDHDDDLGLGDRTFDLVTAIEVVEHLENPGRLFFHVARHLADSGVFLMTTPNIHSVRSRARFFLTGKVANFDYKANPEHLFPIFPSILDRILRRHHLVISQVWTYPEKGGFDSRLIPGLIGSALRLVLPDQYSGDSLCFLMHRDTAKG